MTLFKENDFLSSAGTTTMIVIFHTRPRDIKIVVGNLLSTKPQLKMVLKTSQSKLNEGFE